jgi:hypothetical protein
MYSFQKFGVVLEGGSLLASEKAALHFFLAPAYYFVNTEKLRIPLAIGFDLYNGNTMYYGIGSILSAHYRLAKNFYIGANFGITYAFNNVYDEFVGLETKTVKYKEGTFTQEVPVYESKSHFGSNFFLRPSLVIGLQF